MRRHSESAVRVLRWCEDGDTAVGSDLTCSGCVNGICQAAFACERPEPELPKPQRRFPRPSGTAVLVGVLAAIPGMGLAAYEGLRWLLS